MDQERSASSRKSLNSEIGGEVEVVYFKLKVLKGQKAPWFCCPFYICERLYLPSCPFMEHLLAEKAAGAWPEEPWVLTGSEAFFGRFEICMTTMDTSVLTPQDVQTLYNQRKRGFMTFRNAVTDPQPSANNTGQQTPTGSPPGDAGSARAAARPTGSADEAGSAPEADQGQQVGRAASYHTSTDQGQGGRDSGLASPSAVPSPPAPAAAAAAAASSSQDQPDVPYAPMEVSPSPYESEQRDDSGSGHTLSSSRPHQQQDQAHQVGRAASYHTSTDQGQGGRDSGLASPSAVPSPPAPAAAAAAAASSSQDQPDVPNDNKIEVLPVGSSDGATSPSMRHEK